MFLYLMSIVSLVFQAVFFTLAIAAGLYYLAELVEEYTVAAKAVITWAIIVTALVHIGLIVFEDIPVTLNALGIFQQILHGTLMKDFPIVRVKSIAFALAVVCLILNHYMALNYFSKVYYSLSEVLAYFTICLWIVPFALFVSLSANDYVLPTTGERRPLLNDDNVVTDYLYRKSKKYSLLSFISFAKDSMLPQRSKKGF